MNSEPLPRRIERFLRVEKSDDRSNAPEDDFGALALELFAYQFDRNKPYQAFCQAQGVTAASIRRWEEIPAAPIAAFKSADLATFPLGRAAAVFHSSATTTGTPSRHYLKTLNYYEASLKAGFRRWVLPPSKETLPFLILAPAPGEAPHASLSWMLDVVKRQWGGPGSDYFVQRGVLDEPRLTRVLNKLSAAGLPALLLGTTLAFLKFFDDCAARRASFKLAPGSRLMDTGGMKTQKREISRLEFVEQAGRFLGIPDEACINEYGMCEMSSQFYAWGSSLRMQGPPWVRTRVLDWATGVEADAGRPGLLVHYDLANVDSVLAIQTEDLGLADGNAFIFQGRAPQADLKGCSLAAETFLR